MKMAERLAVLRKQKGLTQSGLAEILDISRQAVSKWEVGETVPTITNLESLSELYEVSLEYLLNDDLEQKDQSRGPEEKEEELREHGKSRKRKEHTIMVACMVVCIMVCLLGLIAVAWNYRGISQEDTEDILKLDEMEGENFDRAEDVIWFSLTWD